MYGCCMANGMVVTKVTVNLTAKSRAALVDAVQLSGGNKTDSINRALQIYAYILREQAAGNAIATLATDQAGETTITKLEFL